MSIVCRPDSEHFSPLCRTYWLVGRLLDSSPIARMAAGIDAKSFAEKYWMAAHARHHRHSPLTGSVNEIFSIFGLTFNFQSFIWFSNAKSFWFYSNISWASLPTPPSLLLKVSIGFENFQKPPLLRSVSSSRIRFGRIGTGPPKIGRL